MKKNIVRAVFLLILLGLSSSPTLVLAQCPPVCGDTNAPADTDGSGLDYSLRNPLAGSGINSVDGLLTAILNVLLVIAVPIIVFFIIFAGFNYVTARGNPEKVKTATRSLTYAIIGGVLILGSVALAEIIKSVVESFRS